MRLGRSILSMLFKIRQGQWWWVGCHHKWIELTIHRRVKMKKAKVTWDQQLIKDLIEVVWISHMIDN